MSCGVQSDGWECGLCSEAQDIATPLGDAFGDRPKVSILTLDGRNPMILYNSLWAHWKALTRRTLAACGGWRSWLLADTAADPPLTDETLYSLVSDSPAAESTGTWSDLGAFPSKPTRPWKQGSECYHVVVRWVSEEVWNLSRNFTGLWI